MTSKTTEELKNIIITCDGAGKKAKEDALTELINRALDIYQQKQANGK